MRWRQRTLQHRSLYCPRCVVVSAVLSGIRPVRSCFPIHSVLFRPSERQHELTVATIKSRDLAGRLPIGHALFQVSALIARQFSLGNAELGFQPAVFPV